MLKRRRRLFLPPLVVLILAFLLVHLTSAGSGYTLNLSSPDVSKFPHLTAYLDVHAPDGTFVHGLTPDGLSVVENGIQVPVTQLQEQAPGVQFVIAITPGPAFAIRDNMGVTRYEYFLQSFLAGSWAQQQAASDDYSLLTQGGPQITHTADPARVKSALENYTPDDPKAVPSLEVLSSALQVASDPLPRPGMERAILFITPLQEKDVSLGLQSILSSASQQNIRIFVWLIAAQENAELPQVEMLKNLSAQTGASFFLFSHDETIPGIATLLEPLHFIYHLGYDSRIASGGAQQVAAQLTFNGEVLTSQPQSFEINLQPPAPQVLSLPAVIERSFPPQSTLEPASNETNLLPEQQAVHIQVTFPDGFTRSLASTSLFVDNVLVARNTSAPFDQFTWDLRPYSQNGMHLLHVEAIDSLGISGKTRDIPVRVTVPTTTQGVIVALSQKRPFLVAAGVVVAAAILLLALIMGGRIHPRPHPGMVKRPVRSGDKTVPAPAKALLHQGISSAPPLSLDPPSVSSQKKATNWGWMERLPWLKRKETLSPALAHLVPLVGSDEPTLPAPMRITEQASTIGSDRQKASLVIADASIEGLHAQFKHEGRSFLIMDAGTVAGTWVNYELVPPGGKQLAHADIIHLGNVGFRFVLSELDQHSKVVVTVVETDR